MADKDLIALDTTVVHDDDAPADTPGGRSDIYEVEGTVGQGGGGVVLRARDRRMDRYVALKILAAPDEAMRVRFEREMRITAKLQHPGVVPIHDTGLWGDKVPFYSMRLVEGRSLRQVLDERHTLAERLQLLPNLLAVAETMAYAHSQAIIHRDLKPANIIVGAYGETVVIDWGLVKDLAAPVDDDPAGPEGAPELAGATVTGQVMGTPAYMPPEQARGDAVDRRADVYALGALLRELITGKAPYAGTDWREMLSRVVRGDLPPTAAGGRRALRRGRGRGRDRARRRRLRRPPHRRRVARHLGVELRAPRARRHHDHHHRPAHRRRDHRGHALARRPAHDPARPRRRWHLSGHPRHHAANAARRSRRLRRLRLRLVLPRRPPRHLGQAPHLRLPRGRHPRRLTTSAHAE
jgi:serine/threonine protein kinase